MHFESVMLEIHQFVQAKGWATSNSEKPQTPRNLATSISIEAAELLECFQWSESASHKDLENELADVLIYALRLAQVVKIDPLEAISKKLERNLRREWPKSDTP
jgi:NTP pyrophosphatase (non-canonical NTP hydrolase)